jgi:hypothetical protein
MKVANHDCAADFELREAGSGFPLFPGACIVKPFCQGFPFLLFPIFLLWHFSDEVVLLLLLLLPLLLLLLLLGGAAARGNFAVLFLAENGIQVGT